MVREKVAKCQAYYAQTVAHQSLVHSLHICSCMIHEILRGTQYLLIV